MSISTIMQPTFNPWIGYFDLMDKVDHFVFYDDVQLVKRTWQTRNRLRNKSGEFWLTIPILKTKTRDSILIMDAEINMNEKWKQKHLASIKHSYSKATYFSSLFPLIQEIYDRNLSTLGDFNILFIETCAQLIGISTLRSKSSQLADITGSKDERLVSINKALNITSYLSPQGSAEYINKDNLGGAFTREGLNLFYHSYKHPKYSQLGNDFIPYLGILDLLFNEGPDQSLEIIRSGRESNINYDEL